MCQRESRRSVTIPHTWGRPEAVRSACKILPSSLCRSKWPKKNIISRSSPRAHRPPIQRTQSIMPRARSLPLIARDPDFPWEGFPALPPGQTGGVVTVALISTLFRGSSEGLWPVFCRAEGPRNCPRPVIRSFISPEISRLRRLIQTSERQRITKAELVVLGARLFAFCFKVEYSDCLV